MTTDTIKTIQRQIVAKIEAGEDYSELSRQLAEERAKIAALSEVEELEKIAARRREFRDRAAKVQEKVKLQGEAIDTFLEARNAVIKALAPILEKARDLPKLQGECYAYHDVAVFGADLRQIPQGYLSKDGFSCPILRMASGQTDSYDVAAMGLFHLNAGLGLLSQLVKGEMTVPQQPAGEFDGKLEGEPEAEPLEVDVNCRVCRHPSREAIDKALQSGRSLRDIETEFNVPRSTLSRHKNRCLKAGVVGSVD